MIKVLGTTTESKQNRTRKLLLAVATLMAAFCMLVASVSATRASGAKSFTPRMSAPSSGDYHYTSENPYYTTGYGMPNCTAYAWGRAYEILGTKPNIPCANASAWYSNNQSSGAYPYGRTPKLGAVACWSHHVAVVEAINGNQVTVSESHASGTYFDTKTLTIGNESSYAGSFYGYIYILSDGVTTETQLTYKTGKYVIDTGSSALNMRSGPGTSYKMVASIPSGTTITVDKVTDSWGRTTYNGKTGWVALWYCDPVTTSTSIFRNRSAAAQASAKESASLVSIQSDEGTSSTTNPVSWMFSYFLPSLVGSK